MNTCEVEALVEGEERYGKVQLEVVFIVLLIVLIVLLSWSVELIFRKGFPLDKGRSEERLGYLGCDLQPF